MKSLFFGLSLLFATLNGISTEVENKIVEDNIDDPPCITVNLSCGVTGCIVFLSHEQFEFSLQSAENYWCGPRREAIEEG